MVMVVVVVVVRVHGNLLVADSILSISDVGIGIL